MPRTGGYYIRTSLSRCTQARPHKRSNAQARKCEVLRNVRDTRKLQVETQTSRHRGTECLLSQDRGVWRRDVRAGFAKGMIAERATPNHTSGRRQQLRNSRLEGEQRALSVKPTRITREAAVRSDDAVARNDDADRIASGRGARGARAARA